MDVIYNSPQFWILSYPSHGGYELFDKESLCTLFLQGPLATRFCAAMEGIPEAARTHENIDALLHSLCTGIAHPIVFH